MFAKLYSNITDSTLMDQPINVRYVFMMLLAIADREGYVASTPKAAAARLSMDQNEFDEAIAILSAPDPNSNFPDHEGRRLIPSDRGRGWRITTYQHYSAIRNEEHKRQYMREYMRNYRAKCKTSKERKDLTIYGDVTSLALLEEDADATETRPDIDADADTDAIHQDDSQPKPNFPKVFQGKPIEIENWPE